MALKHIENQETCPSCDAKLSACHPYLKPWFYKIKAKWPNLHVAWGFRNQADQNQAVLEHRSNLEWPYSPHNKIVNGLPQSLAIDLFEQVGGRGKWDQLLFAAIYAYIKSENDKIFWGGSWKLNKGKEIDSDHFQYDATVDYHPPTDTAA